MTNIEWADVVWNPVVGCTPVSPGCLNCYAATMARRLEGMGTKEYQARSGEVAKGQSGKVIRIAEKKNGRAVFTGEVRTLENRLTDPLHWKKPRRVFVNSMSDLFHESVPFEFIDRVFAVMALCPQHTFQVLTKRPERMAEYLNTPGRMDRFIWRAMLSPAQEFVPDHKPHTWPLPNVWLGTSVEDQARADERIPHLLRCPAAVRFLSCEPLLGSIRLNTGIYEMSGRRFSGTRINDGQIHWVIVGGESGANARPCDVAWIRSIVGQCKASGVPCFVKQFGARPRENFYAKSRDEWEILGHNWEPDPAQWNERDGQPRNHVQVPIVLGDRKGGDPAEWPEDLRVREFPAGAI